MTQPTDKPASVERVELDASGLKALVEAVEKAMRPPRGVSLFDEFQAVESTDSRQAAVDRGVYLFRAAEATPSSEATLAILERLLACFREHIADRNREWSAIGGALAGEGAEPVEFLRRVLANDARHVAQEADRWGVPPESLALLSLYWARPFRRDAADRLLKDLSLASWRMGYCPVCGHWPALGYLAAEDHHRELWCGACGITWRFERIRCPFCLITDSEKLPAITVDDDESWPVELCEECRRYLKHRREEKDAVRNSDLDYVITATLDYVAVNQGYIQESLISVRFDEPDGEAGRTYRAKARYEEGPDGPATVH